MTAEIKVLKFAEGLVVLPPDPNIPINVINQKIRSVEQIDSVTTGINATSVASTSSILRMTNASLSSLSDIAGDIDCQFLILINNTGAAFDINNGSGILTGTGSIITLANNASIWLLKLDSLLSWLVVGGSGGGGSANVIGTISVPSVIDPAIGIPFSGRDMKTIMYVTSNGGADIITANPQIAPGEVDGQELILIYVSDVNTLELNDGNGLDLPMKFISENKRKQSLHWNTSVWSEDYRR